MIKTEVPRDISKSLKNSESVLKKFQQLGAIINFVVYPCLNAIYGETFEITINETDGCLECVCDNSLKIDTTSVTITRITIKGFIHGGEKYLVISNGVQNTTFSIEGKSCDEISYLISSTVSILNIAI